MPKDLMVGKRNVTKLLRQKYGLLRTGWVSLIQVPVDVYASVNAEAIRIIANEQKYTVIYITLGKSALELEKLFNKQDINTRNIFFIDAVAKMFGDKTVAKKRFTYVSGPLDIDAISEDLRELVASLQGEKVCVFLDSITAILLYNSLPRTLRFSRYLNQTLRDLKIAGVLVSVAKGEATNELVTELKKLCDENIVILDVLRKTSSSK